MVGCLCIRPPKTGIERLSNYFSTREQIPLLRTETETPLRLAAQYGYLEIVESLLAKKADPSSTDEDGETPLGLSAYSGHREITQSLLSSGENPSYINGDQTALHFAAGFGQVQLLFRK